MTRHYLTPKENAGVDTVVIGYDRPLRTFFAQAYKETSDEPIFLLWVGFTHKEITDAANIINLVSEYAHIPDELWVTLDVDRVRAPYRSMEESNAVTHWSRERRVNPGEAGVDDSAAGRSA